MYAKIQPVNYRTGQAKCLLIRATFVRLNESATVEWSLMGDPEAADKRDYESGGTQMSAEDYSQWSSDDSYVYTWLATALNLTVESIEQGNYWDS